jgi:hypothetical protein
MTNRRRVEEKATASTDVTSSIVVAGARENVRRM